MFTGIINHTGRVNEKHGSVFTFRANRSFCKRLKTGTSVAVNGICLTTLSMPSSGTFSIEIMPETQKRTMLKNLKLNSLVNLELPAKPGAFLSGHVVQGHIDGTAELRSIAQKKNSRLLRFSIPKSLSKYVVEKGSIAVNGISLTVIDSAPNYFTVGIIPHTWRHTMLHKMKVGDLVNIEVDVIAKYLEKLLLRK